jgi:hypothetical protein
MVMSAVSSVSTPGVLVTVMPLAVAVSTSILSTPVPKLAISLSWSPACMMTDLSILSVTVGTSTSAFFTASTSWDWLIGSSVSFSVVANSSRIRVSTTSGSLRVTMTVGLRVGIQRAPARALQPGRHRSCMRWSGARFPGLLQIVSAFLFMLTGRACKLSG